MNLSAVSLYADCICTEKRISPSSGLILLHVSDNQAALLSYCKGNFFDNFFGIFNRII